MPEAATLVRIQSCSLTAGTSPHSYSLVRLSDTLPCRTQDASVQRILSVLHRYRRILIPPVSLRTQPQSIEYSPFLSATGR